MSQASEIDRVRRLTVQRLPGGLYTHRVSAHLVDRSGINPSAAVPFKVNRKFSGTMTRLLPDVLVGDNHLECRLDGRYSPLFNVLRLTAQLRHHLGWTNLACEVMRQHGTRLPSQLLGVYRTADPAVRRLTPVEVFQHLGTYLPHQLPVPVTPELETGLDFVGVAALERADNGYLVTAERVTCWDKPDFEASVLSCLLDRLGWTDDEFTLVYDGQADTD